MYVFSAINFLEISIFLWFSKSFVLCFSHYLIHLFQLLSTYIKVNFIQLGKDEGSFRFLIAEKIIVFSKYLPNYINYEVTI